ncbi:MAG: acyl--CoA ligase [Clostridia bacterium]|nr:acyl--CoA ligase [Clostridia bacterium]
MQRDSIRTVRGLLDWAAARFNDKPFLKYVRNGSVIERSFAEVRDHSLAFCRMLRDTYPEHAHIAIVSKSSYEYITALCGGFAGGFVMIPMAPETTVENGITLLRDADADAVLYESEFAERMEQIAAALPRVRHTFDLGGQEEFESVLKTYGENGPYAALSDAEPDPYALAALIYTSGTTGEQKGVMLSNFALLENVMYKAYNKDTEREDDVRLSVLPLYHIFCFVSDFLSSLKTGNTLCLNGQMRDLFENLLRFRPTAMRVVPMIAGAMLSRIKAVHARNPALSPAEAAAKVTGGNLRWMLCGGAYLDPKIPEALEGYGIHLRQGYGMSEAGCKVSVPDAEVSMTSVGRVMNNCRVRIRDGEIQVNTPCRMIGYYKRPEATAAAFTEDGWLKTGDLGRLTEYGELFITGRVKNLIILSNGENVSPEGIENELRADPLVSEALVYAKNDRIIAEIYPNSDCAAAQGVTDVAAALEALVDKVNLNALPSHTIAKLIVRDTPIPKTSTGKIKRCER